MVQEQLVDYVSSQMKLGVSRDAIKSALVTAGWVAADVEDTLKKVEGSSPAASSVAAVSHPSSQPSGLSTSTSPAKTAEPQMIRVSDLVSSPSSSVKPTATTTTAVPKETSKVDVSKFGGKISGNTFEAAPTKDGKSSGSKSMLIMEIIGGILILALAGLAWYFYSGNAALASQVSTLNNQAGAVNQQLTQLKAQMDASSTDFATQLGSLTSQNANLALNLSFYAVAPGDSTSSAPITISGLLSGGGKAPYSLTTSLGAKIYVANSSDATISPMLKPLVGQTIELAGTYVPGSDEMTVVSVSSSTTQ